MSSVSTLTPENSVHILLLMKGRNDWWYRPLETATQSITGVLLVHLPGKSMRTYVLSDEMYDSEF